MVKVELRIAILTFDQVAALMEGIDQGNSSIEKLFLDFSLPSEGERTWHFNLKPLVKVKEVVLYDNFLTRQELVDFFAAMSPSTKLRKLEISQRKSSRLKTWPEEEEMDGSSGVMAKAINFLDKVHLDARPYQVCNQVHFQHFELKLDMENIARKSSETCSINVLPFLS